MRKKLLMVLLTVLVAALCLAALTACFDINGKDGKDGVNGANGTNGVDGADGANGKDGVGIKDVIITDDGDLIIYDTNGEVIFEDKFPQCSHSYGDWVEGLKPTCASVGYNVKTCEKCGGKDYEIVAATGHSWNLGTVVSEADCTQKGLKHYSCLKCDQTKTEVIPATGKHNYINGVCEYCSLNPGKIANEYYNGTYGYNYLGTMFKGPQLTQLYTDIDNAVMYFHDDETANAQLNGSVYGLLNIEWTKYGLTTDEAISVWKTYLDDKPLYYWLARSMSVINNALVLAVDEQYANGEVRVAQNNQLYTAIAEYTESLKGKSAYDIAFALHDKIIDDIDYAYNGSGKPEDALWAHTIIGVFENKSAVCEGYARAFQLMLNVCEVENVFVTGQSASQNHAWNLVKLDDGNYYWYDLTWDDTPNKYWGISHDYACATDTDFNSNPYKTHLAHNSFTWGVNFLYGLPEASATAYNGNEIKYLDEFTQDGATYTVVGYNKLNLKYTTSGGDYVIPESVTYANREFKVVSIQRVLSNSLSWTVLAEDVKFNSIHIPASVVFIDECAFACYKKEDALETVTVDEQNPKFTALDGVLFTKSLYTLIYYPHGNTRTEYAIPDETVFIANTAFSNYFYLESLHIGKNLKSNGLGNFFGEGYADNSSTGGNVVHGKWPGLVLKLQGEQQLTVNPENQYFKMKDGILFNATETFVYTCMPYVERLIIPETVTEIEVDAFHNFLNLKYVEIPAGITVLNRLFSGCRGLEEVVLPEGLLEIAEFTFCDCRALTSIVLPNSVQKIGKSAFYGCFNLQTMFIGENVTKIDEGAFRDVRAEIFYKGTSSKWYQLSAGSMGGSYAPTVYFYSEEQPTTSAKYWHYVDGVITKW